MRCTLDARAAGVEVAHSTAVGSGWVSAERDGGEGSREVHSDHCSAVQPEVQEIIVTAISRIRASPFRVAMGSSVEMLKTASKLEITEFICNTNLMEYTTADILKEGINIVNEVSQKENIKFDTFTVLDKYIENIPEQIDGKKRKVLHYYLSKPWEMTNKVHHPGIW